MEKMTNLRKRLGMNQAEFAEFIGLANKATVSRMENGKEAIGPRIKMIMNDKIRILELEAENAALRKMLRKEIAHETEPDETA